MAISRQNAVAAVNAIKDLRITNLFTMVKENQHILEKHYSKDAALEAAQGGQPQGYFKKKTKLYIDGGAAYGKLSVNKKAKIRKILNTNKTKPSQIGKPIGTYNQNAKKTNSDTLHLDVTSVIDNSIVLDIVTAVLNDKEHQLREANNPHKNNRFIVAAKIPEGYVGRSIDKNKKKDTDNVTHAVIVIQAALGSNPQIVTVFPANEQYTTRTPKLV